MTSVNAPWKQPFFELFIDPISHALMQHPVMCAPCGHSFEKEEIEGWQGYCIEKGAPTTCPLCKQEIQDLIRNFLLEQAIEVLLNPNNDDLNNLTDLPTEDQTFLQNGKQTMQVIQEGNAAAGVPNLLASPQSFIKKMVTLSKKVANATSSC